MNKSDFLHKKTNPFQNSIVALLKGPDTQYEKLLMQNNIPKINNPCRDKNSFLQIHVRPLNAKEQKQLSKRHLQSKKKAARCLRFTFPITYPCRIKPQRHQPSTISSTTSSSSRSISNLSHSSFPFQQSLQKTTSQNQRPNDDNQLKSAVSISFIDEKNADISKYTNPKEKLSSSVLSIPSKNTSTYKIRSSNASIPPPSCQFCRSILTNGICSCIVQNLLQLNNTQNKENLSIQLNEIFENLTSNNIII